MGRVLDRSKNALRALRDVPLPPPRPSKEARRLARLHAEVLDAVRVVVGDTGTIAIAEHGAAVSKLRDLLRELDAA